MANQQRHSSLPFFLVAPFTLLLLPLLPHPASSSSLSPPRASSGFSSAVAADEGRCSLVGTATLRRGGNAVDAAVASALCLGVVNPMSSGLGGGAFLLLRMANSGLARAYDMREVAPAAASENMYNVNSQLGITGGLAVAVPGELAGLHLVWQQHGRLPWPSLVKPAIKLAAGGFVVRRYLAFYLNQSAQDILADKGLSEVFAPNGILLRAGDICHRKKLAETLEAIAKEGPGVFYDGIIGEKFVADVKEAGGILTKEDLRNYKVEVKQPLVSDVFGFTVLGVPPPAGGACLILILNILAAYKSTANAIKGPLGLHRIVEAFKHVYAIRMNLGDPSFVNVTDVLADMLSPSFASELQKRISDNTTFPPDYYGGRWNQLNDHGTSHFGIIDGERNAVAMTSTINYPFGAKILSRSTGIVMNDEMGDFSLPTEDFPARTNFIRPFKRPLSSMAPTIVLQDGQIRGVVGASGGTRIITAAAQVFLDYFVKGLNPLSSVVHPRVHHQLIPNVVSYENWTTVAGDHIELKEEWVEALRRKGHILQGGTGAISQLVVQELATDGDGARSSTNEKHYGRLIAISDPRKDGSPSAF